MLQAAEGKEGGAEAGGGQDRRRDPQSRKAAAGTQQPAGQREAQGGGRGRQNQVGASPLVWLQAEPLPKCTLLHASSLVMQSLRM